jgi:tRNA(fMet)-specific endonuclease VapC
MVRYLLDTNVVSQALLAHGDRRVLAHLREHHDSCAVPSPVVHELTYGYERLEPGAKRARLEQFVREAVCRALPILPYDEAAAIWHAAERARLERAGRTPPAANGQIAAIAAVHGLTVVTGNVKHFSDFVGLAVEDWSQAPA